MPDSSYIYDREFRLAHYRVQRSSCKIRIWTWTCWIFSFTFECLLGRNAWEYCGRIILVPPIVSVLIPRLYLQRASHPENHIPVLVLLAVQVWNSWSLL